MAGRLFQYYPEGNQCMYMFCQCYHFILPDMLWLKKVYMHTSEDCICFYCSKAPSDNARVSAEYCGKRRFNFLETASGKLNSKTSGE